MTDATEGKVLVVKALEMGLAGDRAFTWMECTKAASQNKINEKETAPEPDFKLQEVGGGGIKSKKAKMYS